MLVTRPPRLDSHPSVTYASFRSRTLEAAMDDSGYRTRDVLLRRRSSSLQMILLGLPFLLVGIAIAVAPFWATMAEPPAQWSTTVPFGGFFVAIGALLMFARAQVTINRPRGIVTKGWGLLAPFYRISRPLSEFDRVTLSTEFRRTKRGSHSIHPVRLEGGGKPVTCETTRELEVARASAAEIAGFLELPLVDLTGPAPVVATADGRVEEGVPPTTAKQALEKWDLSKPPAGMETQYHAEGRALVFDIPPRGIGPGAAALGVLGLLGAIGVAAGGPAFLLRFPDVHIGVRLFVSAFLALWAALAIFYLARDLFLARSTRVRVMVDPEYIRIEKRSALRTRVAEIPVFRYQGTVVGVGSLSADGRFPLASRGGKSISPKSPKGIHVFSDHGEVAFGAHLAPEELQWLCAAIEKTITPPRSFG